MNIVIYFDYTATTKPSLELLELHQKINKEYWFNTETLYNEGIKGNALLEKSEKVVIDCLKLTNKRVLFTSGATEANNTAIYGVCSNYYNAPKHIITSCIEHASVLKCFRDLENRGFKVAYLKVNKLGFIDLNELENAITNDTILVSIMWVNNIIGSIQPIKDIINIVKKHKRIKLHVDAVQGISKLEPDFNFNDLDLFTISGHKLHGLKGTGLLVYNDKVNLSFLHGGHQQRGIRPGTVDLAGAVVMAKTLKLALIDTVKKYSYVKDLNDYLIYKLKDKPYIILNHHTDNYSPYILSITFKKIKGETVLHFLEQKNILVGTGSACNSHSKDQEETLLSVLDEPTLAINTIRVSLDFETTKNELDLLIKYIEELGNK